MGYTFLQKNKAVQQHLQASSSVGHAEYANKAPCRGLRKRADLGVHRQGNAGIHVQ